MSLKIDVARFCRTIVGLLYSDVARFCRIIVGFLYIDVARFCRIIVGFPGKSMVGFPKIAKNVLIMPDL